jgi:recombination protein RecA
VSLSKAREKELRAVVSEISKELKLAPGDLVLGKDLEPERPRTTTGILALDVALGGGLPLDQWVEIVGHESSGKTATTLQIVAQQMRLDPDWVCLWVAAEGLEPEFAVMNGVDLDRLVVVDINSMEEAFETVIRAMEKRAVDGVVIDSYPALVPTGEYDREMSEGAMPAVGARLFNQFFRKVQKAARRSQVNADRHWLGIIINQWRDTIGVMFGDPRITPGGKGKNYSYYVRIETAREEFIDNELKGKAKEVVGQTIRIKVFKNKSGPPQRVCHYDLYVSAFDDFAPGDIDVVKDVFNTAEALQVITREEGKNTYYFGKEKLGGSRPASLSRFDSDTDLVERVQREVMMLMDRKRSGSSAHEPEPDEPEPPKKRAKLKRVSS